jgi:hypothetical protein
MDEQGGMKTVELPDFPNWWGLDFDEAFSPNGKFFAYYTGDYLDPPYDLRICILRLPDLQTLATIPLLAPDYPENFTTLAQSLAKNPPEQLKGFSLDEMAERLRSAFEHGIMSYDWSPDGETLAFAGQMDGLSSDLYTYDMQTGNIARLTSGNEMIQKIDWSPDGNWIGHGSAYVMEEGSMDFSIYIAARNGSRLISAGRRGGMYTGWFGSKGYLMHSATITVGNYGLHVLDVPSGSVRYLWEYSFNGFINNPEKSELLLELDADTPEWQLGQWGLTEPVKAGIYRIDYASGRNTMIQKGGNTFMTYWGVPDFPYVFSTTEKTFAVKNDGSFLSLKDGAWYALPSPDSRYLILYNIIENDPLLLSDNVISVIVVLDENAQQIGQADVSDLKTQCMVWKPDDTALTFQTDQRTISLLDIPFMKVRTLTDDFTTESSCEFHWV